MAHLSGSWYLFRRWFRFSFRSYLYPVRLDGVSVSCVPQILTPSLPEHRALLIVSEIRKNGVPMSICAPYGVQMNKRVSALSKRVPTDAEPGSLTP